MQRRAYLRTLGALPAISALAGCSTGGDSASSTPTAGATPTTSEVTESPTTTAPAPTQRALAPYQSWLVAPTPVGDSHYEFTNLSLSTVRRDATSDFAELLNTYWRQRTSPYFGVSIPVDSLDAVLTVNHTRNSNESYRVAGGSFDRDTLRPRLADAGFTADGFVGDVQRFVRTDDSVQRIIGLHPDIVLSIGAMASATDPLATALDQHAAETVRADANAGLAALIDYFGTADYVTGRELEPAVETYPLSTAVATGRRLDVGATTSRTERVYVLPPDTAIDRAAVEEEIETRHAGQPIDEFHHEGRIVAVAGEVENSLVRLV